MKWISLISICLLLSFSCESSKSIDISSPDNKIMFTVSVDDMIEYSVNFGTAKVIDQSKVLFEFQNAPMLGMHMEVVNVTSNRVDESWKPVLKRYESIRNIYNEVVIEMQEKNFPRRKINMEIRAYDDGVAFRMHFLPLDTTFETTLMNELTEFNFQDDYTCWAVDYKEFDSHQESEFVQRQLSEITDEMLTGLPLTLKFNDKLYGAITEAALVDYAGMYLSPSNKCGDFSLKSQLAPRHGKEREGEKVIFKGAHSTPWRVVLLGETPGKLVESELIQNLNAPCEIEDPSWIKPGVSAWDHWWSGEVLMEQDVIYEYIDLASEMYWEYMLIDWQWYGQFDQADADIMTVAPQLNMKEILDYAKTKKIKCWLWLYWTDVDKADFDAACKLYHDWGIAGIKIDFMARDDQEMVNWYHKVVKTAAKHQLMVDFHGAYKPTGWRRTYPNLMTREGVLGNEYQKWSYRATPEHDCTIPFTRMLAGPMDYTPGGFLNCNADEFKTGSPTRVQGTRAHELAKFVIYDSPFLVACDHPDNYKFQVGRGFLKEIVSVWDDTRVLNGSIGEYITMLRRSNDKWFIGAMTNSQARSLSLDLDFLEDGKSYELVSYSDFKETKLDAKVAEKKSQVITSKDRIEISMLPGGGYAAFIVPAQ